MSQVIYPLHRCKTIYLVRHAEGIHNLGDSKDPNFFLSDELFDAHLTPLGWLQIDGLRKHINSCKLTEKIELVVVSPTLRTLQTAVGVFGGEVYCDDVDHDMPPLMVSNAGNSTHPAISSLNCPPFVAMELCRERLGVKPYQRRRSISEYKPLFPAVDFSLIESDIDILWKPDVRETSEEIAARGKDFFKWLWTRKEKEIAIVSHSAFLFYALSAFGDDCHSSVKAKMCKRFDNCEMRSFVIVDRSSTGLNLPNSHL